MAAAEQFPEQRIRDRVSRYRDPEDAICGGWVFHPHLVRRVKKLNQVLVVVEQAKVRVGKEGVGVGLRRILHPGPENIIYIEPMFTVFLLD